MKCVSLLLFSSISVDSSNIFVDHRQTALFDAYESHNGPINGFLLGDSGYMLREWLLIPVGRQRLHAARMATDSCWETAATC